MTEIQHTMTTAPSELGEVAVEGVQELLRRGTRGLPVAAYADGPSPISWATIAEGGWDQFGILDGADGASARDLVALARAWGRGCIKQPLLPTLLAKRYSAAAAENVGPVTFALPLPDSDRSFVPFGQLGDEIVVATGLGVDRDELVPVPAGAPDELGLVSLGSVVDRRTELSDQTARELAVVLAAEATGAAEQLLADSLAFVKERVQFGKPIGTFQAVKHQLADAAISAELAETAVIWGSERLDEAFRGAAFATRRSLDIAQTAVQAHGGLGFTWEMGLHFPFRQIMLARELVTALEARHG